ncbi:MAG: hypothetical protein VX492_01555 [Candidatus Thermoplasmatota archaeon]|nr:hypothetical protein [Candidatus Thermoplasmatota archaeon]
MRVPVLAFVSLGGTLFFVGALFMLTATDIPFFAEETEEEINIAFYGSSGNLSYSQSSSGDSLGWAVYVFGEYEDSNEDGKWDSCPEIQVLPINESGEDQTPNLGANNSFYQICGPGYERNDSPSMIYVGQICHNPVNDSTPDCEVGNYSIESNQIVRLIEEFSEEKKPILSLIVDTIAAGLRTGRTFLCGGIILVIIGGLLHVILGSELQVSITKTDGSKAEWRAYALSQTERGNDGLPKAFSRHKTTKDKFSKPRKGNVRGGVHKTGGLHLSGWTSEDSDKEYKKKVQDRRKR